MQHKILNQDDCRILLELQKTNIRIIYFIDLILDFFQLEDISK